MAFHLPTTSLLTTIGLSGVAAAFSTSHATPPRVRAAAYAGVYAYGSGPAGPSGRLTIYPESDSTILFFLDLNTGKPAYSSGQLLQRALVRGTTASCAFNAGYSSSAGCQLRLTLQPQAIVVQTVSGQTACGFGNGVHADHRFQRQRAGVPQSFQDGTGKTVLFKGLSPERYAAGSR